MPTSQKIDIAKARAPERPGVLIIIKSIVTTSTELSYIWFEGLKASRLRHKPWTLARILSNLDDVLRLKTRLYIPHHIQARR